MAMGIVNNYSNFANGYADAGKRPDSKVAAGTGASDSADSKDKVQEYYEKLCKKFPQINININGGALPSSRSKATVNLSYGCLRKMANDPEFAKEVEWNLSGEATANFMVYGWAQRDGVALGNRTVTYDANGNRQSSCGGMRTANAGSGNGNPCPLQKKYGKQEQQLLKARKKREEKEKMAKKLAEKKAEGKRAAERRPLWKEWGMTKWLLVE